MIKQTLIAALTAATLITSGTSIAAQTTPAYQSGESKEAGAPRHRRGDKANRLPNGRQLEDALEYVELPADVRGRIDALLDDSHKVNRALRRSLRTAHKGMRGLLSAGNPDEAAILLQADEIGRMQTEMQKDRLLTLIRIRAQLSPEQREQLTQRMASQRRHHGRKGERHHKEVKGHKAYQQREERNATAQ